MRPVVGDLVKFTDRFSNSSTLNWTGALKDLELEVMNVKLKTMVPFKIYTIFIMSNGMLHKIDINETGQYTDGSNNVGNDIVFEYFVANNTVFSIPATGAPAQSNPQPQAQTGSFDPSQHFNFDPPATVPSKPATADETNSICPLCGSPAIDLIFNTKCTNPSCSNH